MDAVNYKHKATFATKSHTVEVLACSPDSAILAGGRHKELHLWNLETGERTPTFGQEGIKALAFSPDRKILASGSRDTKIRLWDTNSGRLMDTLVGHSGSVTSLAFRAHDKIQDDGKTTLVSLSEDGTVLKWNVKHIIDSDVVVENLSASYRIPLLSEDN